MHLKKLRRRPSRGGGAPGGGYAPPMGGYDPPGQNFGGSKLVAPEGFQGLGPLKKDSPEKVFLRFLWFFPRFLLFDNRSLLGIECQVL